LEKSHNANMQHGDWKMTKTVLEKAMGFLPQTYTKVTLPISQNEIALSIVLAGIGMSFLMISSTCRPKYLL